MYPENYPFYAQVMAPCRLCMYAWRMPVYPEGPMEPEIRQKPTPPEQASKTQFTTEEAYNIGKRLGIDWQNNPFDVEQFRIGLNTELEHGLRDPATNVTGNDPILTGKIALAHLNEFPDYYTRLTKLEDEAKAFWKRK